MFRSFSKFTSLRTHCIHGKNLWYSIVKCIIVKDTFSAMLMSAKYTRNYSDQCCGWNTEIILYEQLIFQLLFMLPVRENLIKWVRCPSLRASVRPSVRTYVGPSVRALTFHKNVFSRSTRPIRNKFDTRHQCLEAMSSCAPRLDQVRPGQVWGHTPEQRVAASTS